MTLSHPGCRLVIAFLCLLLIPLRFVAAQGVASAPRILQAINEKQVVALKGNVHPLARAEFDQGAVADSRNSVERKLRADLSNRLRQFRFARFTESDRWKRRPEHSLFQTSVANGDHGNAK